MKTKDWILQKYTGIPVAMRASLAFMLCNVIQKAIAFLTTPIFTRVLDAEQYGEYSLYLSWYNVIIIVVTLYLHGGVINNGMVRYPKEREQFISSLQGLASISVICFFGFYLLTARWVDSVIALPKIVMFAMFADMLVQPAYQFWITRQRFEYKYKVLAIITVITALGNPLLGLAMVSHTADKGTARILSVCFVNIAVGLVFYVLNFYKGKIFFNKRYWVYAIGFSLPLIPHHLSQFVLNQVDRIMIEKICGMSDVAIYSVACSIGVVMGVISSSINASFIPFIYKSLEKGNCEKLRKISTALIAFMAVVTIAPCAMAPEAISILGTQEYNLGVWAVVPVAMSSFFSFLFVYFSIAENYYSETKIMMVASTIAAVANVVLNLIFIPMFGYVAAAYTTLACYAILAMIHYFAMRWVAQLHGLIEPIVNVKAILIIMAVMFVFCFGMETLYNLPLVRYALIAITLISAMLNYRKLKAWLVEIMQ